MATQSPVLPTVPVRTLTEFLESTPPNTQIHIPDLEEKRAAGWVMREPDLQLHCGSDLCNGARSFQHLSATVYLDDGWNYEFVTYLCRNCRRTDTTYVLA